MVNFFHPDGFSADFLKGFPAADAVRRSLYAQGLKMLDAQQQIVSTQLAQMKMLTEAGQKQALALAELQSKALHDGIELMMAAEKSAMDFWKPAEA
jgi:hypothetical protein